MMHPLLTMNLLSIFLVRIFASYARLGPSADRRRPVVLRGSAVRPVTQQMSKRTTKNAKQTQFILFLRQKCRFRQKTNPIRTQNKAIFTPKNQPQNQNKPNLCWPARRSLGEGGSEGGFKAYKKLGLQPNRCYNNRVHRL